MPLQILLRSSARDQRFAPLFPSRQLPHAHQINVDRARNSLCSKPELPTRSHNRHSWQANFFVKPSGLIVDIKRIYGRGNANAFILFPFKLAHRHEKAKNVRASQKKWRAYFCQVLFSTFLGLWHRLFWISSAHWAVLPWDRLSQSADVVIWYTD